MAGLLFVSYRLRRIPEMKFDVGLGFSAMLVWCVVHHIFRVRKLGIRTVVFEGVYSSWPPRHVYYMELEIIIQKHQAWKEARLTSMVQLRR